MGSIKMQLGYKCSVLELPCTFVDYYMTDCLPVYPLIYIFSLRRLLAGESVSSGEIGERFNLTEGDVIKAWRHWESVGLVEIEKPSARKGGSEEMSIVFLPVRQPEKKPEKAEEVANVRPVQMETRPQYTVQELTVYRNQSKDIESLFSRAEQTLGKLLTYNDMNAIFGFYDWLRLPLDVIEYLLTYCADNGHRNLRYIEKCALDWADNDIDDIEKALTYVQAFDRGYREILHYMGQNTGYPTPSHRKYMDKWLNQWQMPMELIMEACDRSVVQIDKPKFSYVDKILADWHKKGVTTIDGVREVDAEFAKSKEKPASVRTIKPVAAKPKPNRFVNFNQRENDYAHFEKLERAYLAQKLSEG